MHAQNLFVPDFAGTLFINRNLFVAVYNNFEVTIQRQKQIQKSSSHTYKS